MRRGGLLGRHMLTNMVPGKGALHTRPRRKKTEVAHDLLMGDVDIPS